MKSFEGQLVEIFKQLEIAKMLQKSTHFHVVSGKLIYRSHGNTSKLSFDYQNRPLYSLVGDDLIRASSRKTQYVLQYQFFF